MSGRRRGGVRPVFVLLAVLTALSLYTMVSFVSRSSPPLESLGGGGGSEYELEFERAHSATLAAGYDPLSMECKEGECNCIQGYSPKYGLYEGQRQLSCGLIPDEPHVYFESSNRLRDVLKEVAVDGEVVVSFAEATYEDVLLNLVLSLEKVGMHNYLLLSLDEKIHNSLNALHIRNVYVGDLMPGNVGLDEGVSEEKLEQMKDKGYKFKDLKNVFVFRMAVLRAILGLRYSIMSVDADVVFTQNVYPFLDSTNYDFEALAATFPKEETEKWGWTINGGFFHIVSNPAGAEYLSNALSMCKKFRDDQKCYNRFLSKRKVTMTKVQDCQVPGGECVISSDIFVRVRMLDTKLFATAPRLNNRQSLAPNEGLVAVHACALPKTGATKQSFFEWHGVWALSENYLECGGNVATTAAALECIRKK